MKLADELRNLSKNLEDLAFDRFKIKISDELRKYAEKQVNSVPLPIKDYFINFESVEIPYEKVGEWLISEGFNINVDSKNPSCMFISW